MASTTAAPHTSSKRPLSEPFPLRQLSPWPPVVLLAIYPLTLFLGSLYSLISPTARPTSQSTSVSPTVPSDSNVSQRPVNYFARKDNIFNVYFVKIGWVWTTLAFLSLLLTQPAFTSALTIAETRLRRVVQAFLRYVLVTVAWILTTQWFFGPAIIDRSFTATGGKCEDLRLSQLGNPVSELGTLLTAARCKASGGQWTGGHDISGHVFMLVLASAFLVFELVGSSWPVDEDGDDKAKNDDRKTTGDSQTEKWSRNFVWALAGLSWWMLFMTAIWFHTWLEKLSGLIIALSTIYIVYFLPRTFLPWRNVIGIPGL